MESKLPGINRCPSPQNFLRALATTTYHLNSNKEVLQLLPMLLLLSGVTGMSLAVCNALRLVCWCSFNNSYLEEQREYTLFLFNGAESIFESKIVFILISFPSYPPRVSKLWFFLYIRTRR